METPYFCKKVKLHTIFKVALFDPMNDVVRLSFIPYFKIFCKFVKKCAWNKFHGLEAFISCREINPETNKYSGGLGNKYS
jgi:hypothetical protein